MEKNKKCACCGEFSLPMESAFEICPICGWQEDDIQEEDPTLTGGANDMSLQQAKEAYKNKKPIN